MMKEKFSTQSHDLVFTATAHACGMKKTLFTHNDTLSNLTQFAFGKLRSGESIPAHIHPTMEEFFFFLKGKGTYVISDTLVELTPGIAVRIPAGSAHTMHADEDLEFVYFGIAISEDDKGQKNTP
ncbi:MAG: cupin domain-containing protein [Chitinophagaceae bacterium]